MDGFEPCQVRGRIHCNINHEHSTLRYALLGLHPIAFHPNWTPSLLHRLIMAHGSIGSLVRPLMTRSKAVSDRLSCIGTSPAPGGSFAAREEACQSYLTHYPCPRDAQPSNATGPSTPPSRDHDINDLVKRASPPPSTCSTNPILVFCPDPNPSVS